MTPNENSKHQDNKNWHNEQNQAVPDSKNAHEAGHAQNKDQLNRLTDRKDNQDVRNPKAKHNNDRP